MKENSIEEDIKNAEHFIKSIKTDKEYKEENGWHGYYNKEIVELARMLEHILSDYKRVLKENEELKNEIMEKELEIVGKEEYTKASMGEIIEQYYTANEDCITKQKIEKLIEELKQDDINMTRKYKEKKNITGELLGIDKVRVRAYREKTREINEKLHKLLIETKGK